MVRERESSPDVGSEATHGYVLSTPPLPNVGPPNRGRENRRARSDVPAAPSLQIDSVMKRRPRLEVGALTLALACGGSSRATDDAHVDSNVQPDAGVLAMTELPDAETGGGAVAPPFADGSAPTADASSMEGGAPSCAPLRHYVFKQAAPVPLGCDAEVPAQIIDQPIPVSGKAVGRATFTVSHDGANLVTHFWNLSVHVGKPTYAYGLGDDVCPGTQSARMNLGFGDVAPKTNRARLDGYSGAEECVPGTLTVTGGVLEVWVEDDQPQVQ